MLSGKRTRWIMTKTILRRIDNPAPIGYNGHHGIVAQLVAQETFNFLVVGSNPTDPIMTDNETIELLTGACRAYDRLSIVMDQMMEYWLEGNANPPKELIDAYYDAKDDVGEHINVGRIHEQIVPHNGEFFEKIESQFGLDRRPNL